jgi:F-type H+-transporting ATPase subunit delta
MSQLADRYAGAFFEVTQKKGNTQDCLQTLKALKISMSENKSIRELFNTPLINDMDKKNIIKKAVGNDLNDELSSFIDLLSKNNRLKDLTQITTSYEEKAAEGMGLIAGTVRSATELTDIEKSEVKKSIEKELSTKVELTFSVDSSMIGGIEAKVGSYIFEDSIKTHMQKLNDYITRRVQ